MLRNETNSSSGVVNSHRAICRRSRSDFKGKAFLIVIGPFCRRHTNIGGKIPACTSRLKRMKHTGSLLAT
jgi:hypothetical protein